VNGDKDPDLVLGGEFASTSVWVVFSTLVEAMRLSGIQDRPLNVASNYNIRFDSAPGDFLSLHNSPGNSIGDVNGDGFSDLILAALGADNNGADSGSAYIIFSSLIQSFGTGTGMVKPLSSLANFNIRYDGNAGDLTAASGFVVADINGDKHGDLLFSGFLADNNGINSGSVWLIFSSLIDDVGTSTGNIKLLSNPANYNFRFDGTVAQERLGVPVPAAFGDVNRDGKNDLLLAASEADQSAFNSGSAWVLFSGLIKQMIQTGTPTGNNKPLSDLANFNIRFDGAGATDSITAGVMDIGDVNNDGFGDLLLGGLDADHNGPQSGSLYIMLSSLMKSFGTSTGQIRPLATPSNFSIRFDGSAGDNFTSGATILDVNGNGVQDLVVVGPAADNNGPNSGSVWVFFPSLIREIIETGGPTGNIRLVSNPANYNLRIDGDAAGDFLGSAYTLTAHDFNGDKKEDLVLGSFTKQSFSGAVWIIFTDLLNAVGNSTGNNLPLSNPANYSVRFDGASGDSVGLIQNLISGDINGDKLNDLILGAGLANHNGAFSGSAYVFFGPRPAQGGAPGTEPPDPGCNDNECGGPVEDPLPGDGGGGDRGDIVNNIDDNPFIKPNPETNGRFYTKVSVWEGAVYALCITEDEKDKRKVRLKRCLEIPAGKKAIIYFKKNPRSPIPLTPLERFEEYALLTPSQQRGVVRP
jgi:hypothetical protein